MYTLSCYIAEKLPILKHCWPITCLVTLVSCSPSNKIAEAYFILIRCLDVPHPETRSTYTLFWYIAELFPILKHCWRIPCAITWLSYTLSWYIVELWSILIHCCQFSRNVVDSQSESSITSLKSPGSCRLGCRFLCSMITWSESTHSSNSSTLATVSFTRPSVR